MCNGNLAFTNLIWAFEQIEISFTALSKTYRLLKNIFAFELYHGMSKSASAEWDAFSKDDTLPLVTQIEMDFISSHAIILIIYASLISRYCLLIEIFKAVKYALNYKLNYCEHIIPVNSTSCSIIAKLVPHPILKGHFFMQKK